MRNPENDTSEGLSRRNYLGLAGTSLAALSFAPGTSAAKDSVDSEHSEHSERTLIRNGTVLTVDPDIGTLHGADVLIEDGRIEQVGHDIEPADAATIDATDMIVTPGLVNTHLHTWQAGVRATASDWSFLEYLDRMLGAVSAVYTPEDAYLGNLFGALGQLNAGTTTVLDWFHIANSPEHSDRAIDGLADASIRAVFAHGPPGDDSATWWENSSEPHPDDVRRLSEERFPSDDGLLTLAMGIRGPDYSTDEVVRQDIELARELDVPASMHIGSLGPGGVSSLDEMDLLGDDLNYVHANRLTDEEFALIGESNGSVSTTPEVEMQMVMGWPVVGKVMDAGGVPSVGVDIVSAVSDDLFTQTRFAVQVQRMLNNVEYYEANESVESLSLSAHQALELATIEGARALGLENDIGSLTPGKRADVTLFRADDLGTAPVYDPAATVVFQAGVENVDTVLVDGNIVKQNGDMLNTAGRTHQSQLIESGQRVLEAADLDQYE